jgi:two-component system sensor histidine kinase KdpD
MEEKRPNPDAILAQIKEEEVQVKQKNEKGKLKIFLGYCAGVGKTYRMLQEAGTNKKNGADIVIAYVEMHGRKETEMLLSGLEVLPRKKIEYLGVELNEMDVDEVLKRRPAIAVVDELAHSNAPGSRHQKRYQDVEELLNAGIDVFTTINIQHVESLIDVVHQISGVNIYETVPDRLLETASEVELVDLTPEKLIERFKEGKVYVPKKAEQAMRQFFRKGNLLPLRELSLQYTAKHVDEDMRVYAERHTVPGPWNVGSRLLVGITASTTSERLLRFTHRMSQDLDAQWFAVYVESPQQLDMDEKQRLQLDRNIRLAEELGANVIILKGTDMAEEILSFAKEKGVNLIIAGPSRRSFVQRILKGSFLKELISNCGPINILIAGQDRYDTKLPERNIVFRKKGYKPYLISLIAIAVTVLLGYAVRSSTEPINIGMILLLPSIASGLLWGIRVGFFASILAVASFDFFFVPPYLTFRVADLRFFPSFVVFMLISIIISYLAKSVRQEAESSRHREKFIYSLYTFSKAIMGVEGLEDILNRAVNSISEAFESDVVIFLQNASGKLEIAAQDKESIILSETEKAVAVWVYNNNQPAGRSTKTLSSATWYYLPLKVQEKTIGAVGIKTINSVRFLTAEQDQLFESFANIVALAVKRVSEKV